MIEPDSNSADESRAPRDPVSVAARIHRFAAQVVRIYLGRDDEPEPPPDPDPP
ncbi:hypothetical protein [Kutzneria buriramensis]|uniref:Uncharacterized protein n=1 Tax=Kutzneria buriramensis TaxID=1045776 RepID=A0A3E0GT10_9PSEU|nr:hypothetical protein [Kutzneria buriramensis]REH26176.1 hypothetical protein BCF44_13431 [Kutzneria buriramensis]